MRRLPILKLILAIVALTALLSVVLVSIRWNGLQGSTAAVEIDRLLDVMIVLSSFVFAVVVVMMGYALIKFRAKPGDESDGEPIHGNTRLEIVWTVIPTIIVLFAAGYSWVVLDRIEAREPDRLQVNVFSQQFAWNFTYPDAGKHSSDELRVPVNRQVEFDLYALDVLHAFWVPEWRMKQDTVPGIVTDTVVTPTEEGTYQLICTELCGAGHTTMRATVVVQSEQEFERWLNEQNDIPDAYTPESVLEREPDYN